MSFHQKLVLLTRGIMQCTTDCDGTFPDFILTHSNCLRDL